MNPTDGSRIRADERFRRFDGVAEGDTRGRIVVRLPFDPSEAWGCKARHHVTGTVAGRGVRGPLTGERAQNSNAGYTWRPSGRRSDASTPWHDRTYRSDVPKEAWRRVRSNRGAAGVDRETLADVEGDGVELRGTIRYLEAA